MRRNIKEIQKILEGKKGKKEHLEEENYQEGLQQENYLDGQIKGIIKNIVQGQKGIGDNRKEMNKRTKNNRNNKRGRRKLRTQRIDRR